MRVRPISCLSHFLALGLLLAAVPSCGSPKKFDWKNCEVHWKYGPTKGAARSEHLIGTGTRGDDPITGGWNCLLSDGKTLTVKPYQLNTSHKLLGKTALVISMFDKSGGKLHTVRSETLTQDTKVLTFELTEDITKKLWDLIIWYGKA